MTLPTRGLFLHPDPAVVGDWCREHARAGSVVVAPSASARRRSLLHASRNGEVTLGLTVVSPSRLLPLLESRAGLTSPRTLPPTLERLLVGECARAARVPLFDDDGHDAPAGAVSAVAKLIRSLRLERITPAQFVMAGGDARAADAYERFERRRVGLGFTDEAERIVAIIEQRVPALALVIEDPAFPNRSTWELYSAVIASALSCHVGISALDAGETAPRWTSMLGPLGFATSENARAPDAPIGANTRAIGGVGMHGEIELVAREMLALLRSSPPVHDDSSPSGTRPLRPSDILGVAPNRRYLGQLNAACTRLGIPVASPRKLDTADVPLVRALLDFFRLLADPNEDTPERGLALLGTPYLGLPLDVHDRLSRALIRRGLGGIRSWRRFAASTRRTKFIELAGTVARLAARLEGERSPRELASALTSLGLDLGFLSAGRRANLKANRDDVLRTDQQGWEALVGAAEELHDALHAMGITRITARRWLSELTDVVSGSTVRVDARARDGVHLTIAGAGLPAAAHVFAVGWREGLVPRRTREDPLLPDRVKKALNDQGAMFVLAVDRATLEHERRERVRRAARETLTISWPATGEDGGQLLPSFYMDDLGIADRVVRSIGDTTWPLTIAASRGERVARATFLAHHRPADTLGNELALVRETLGSLTTSEERAYTGVLHAGQIITLPEDVLAECTPLAGKMSASQARQVAHCLYEHFGKKRLALEALASPEVDPLVLGTIAHCVLNDMGRAGFDPAVLDGVLSKRWDAHIPRASRDAAAVRFEREILLGNLGTLVANERAHLAATGSEAAFFELSFGLGDEGCDAASRAGGLAVSLPPGAALRESVLRGVIDRVDVIVRAGKRYGVALDYKLGKGESYKKEMEELADFQLPIYCEVLPLFGIEPVGAFYLGIAGGERYGVVRSDFAGQFVPEGTKGVRVLAPEEFSAYMRLRQDALRAEIARLARGELVVKPRNDDCGYCDLRPVCRIGTFGVGGTSADD